MSLHHHHARKRFGQNFLVDQSIIHRIVSLIRPQEGQNLVEIGPGLGALTFPVLAQAKRLTVIELDRDLIPKLIVNAQDVGELIVHSEDALTFDFQLLRQGSERLRIFGNLPYNISTPLMFHLLDQIDVVEDLHFMLQQEVVQRLAATPGTKAYGRLSVMVQYFCSVDALLVVPPEAFNPAPQVTSAIVGLIPHRPLPHQASDFSQFADLVRQAFAHKRKTLKNNLKEFVPDSVFQELGINPNERAENLPVSAYVAISNKLTEFS